MNRIWARILAAAVAVLVLALVYEWWPGEPPAATRAAPPRIVAGAPTGARLAARDTEGWANSILARPLFSISRKPPKPPPVRGTATQEGLPRLSGIMISAGVKRAIFAGEGGGKPLVLGEGASLADTSIRTIGMGEVTLASGQVLRPTYDKQRVPSTTTTGFNPAGGITAPNFQNPVFPNPGFPNPGFPNPNFQPPPFQGGGFPPPAAGQGTAADGADAAPAPPPPPFRGIMPPPPRRE